MPKFGLIGYPLSHSFSKSYFNEKFRREGLSDHHYELYPLEHIEQFPALLERNPELVGINVTIPYKRAVISYLDELDEGAEAIGAVNCIHRVNERLVGYNTDVFGFQSTLVNFLQKYNKSKVPLKALVFGTGGAAQAVVFTLRELGISFKLVSRTKKAGQLTYPELTEKHIQEYLLLINTTPLGMSPKVDDAPAIPYSAITVKHLLYDLIYNPEKTVFLQRGESAGAAIMNGLEMLYAQADKNWEIWTTNT
jgi:shikimate dehydrogenase